MKIIKGRCWVFDDNVTTDDIIATRHMLLKSKIEMSQHAFEAILSNFARKVKRGDIVVAGNNFGRGSAREQAPEVLKTLGIGAVIASSFNPVFFRNSINIGIPTFICRTTKGNFKTDDNVEVEMEEYVIKNTTCNKMQKIEKMPKIIEDIISFAGLENYYTNIIMQKNRNL